METNAASDAELLARISAGDEAALRELIQRHSGWLLLRLRRRAGDEDLAATALQDAFVASGTRPAATGATGTSGPGCGGSPSAG
ncbi:MAG: hypothetical protein LKI24_03490 [Acidipropionibacterium sp.]|jgi:RNA polymerase sigma-70 factor (ECF subfamily)|nr:hypothetical protein [Acidipropionibacterium sp.]